MKMQPITILLPPEIIEKVQIEAKVTGINKGVLLRSIVMKHYTNQKGGIEIK